MQVEGIYTTEPRFEAKAKALKLRKEMAAAAAEEQKRLRGMPGLDLVEAPKRLERQIRTEVETRVPEEVWKPKTTRMFEKEPDKKTVPDFSNLKGVTGYGPDGGGSGRSGSIERSNFQKMNAQAEKEWRERMRQMPGLELIETPKRLEREIQAGVNTKVEAHVSKDMRVGTKGPFEVKQRTEAEPAAADATFGGKMLRTINAGAGVAVSSFVQGVDMLVTMLEEIERLTNSGWTTDGEFVKGDSPLVSSMLGRVHDGADVITKQADTEVERSASNWDSKTGKFLNELAINGVAVAPMIFEFIASGGASAAKEIGPALGTLGKGLKDLVGNWRFWPSFLQNGGESFRKAKAAGASDNDAIVAGIYNGLIGGIMDVGGGGGDQWMDDKSLTAGQIVGNLGKDALEQGAESYVEGAVSRMAERIYSADKPLYSATDQNAVFSPKRDAQQFAMDTLTSLGVEGTGYAVKRFSDDISDALQKRGKSKKEAEQAAKALEEADEEKMFDADFEKGYNEVEDRADYERMQDALGKNAPETFKDYQDLKYYSGDWPAYSSYASALESGNLTPMASFEIYQQKSAQIDHALLGVKAANGVTITGKSDLFVANTIGSVAKRQGGVDVQGVLYVLTHPNEISPVMILGNRRTQRFTGKYMWVVVDVDTGTIIQAKTRNSTWR